MKSLLLLLLCCFAIINVDAADNITVFSNTGYKFWVIINGEKINSNASERVVFNKKKGEYKLRIIVKEIDGEGSIDDKTSYPIEVKENYNHLFEVTVDSALATQFNTLQNLKSISVKQYSLVNTESFSGRWKLKINDILLKNVNVRVLQNGELSEFTDVVISDEDGKAVMQGKLDRTRNAININKVSDVFYLLIKNKYIIYKEFKCDWFYYNFDTTFYMSQKGDYASNGTEFYYYLSNNPVICNSGNVANYNKNNQLVNMTLYR